MGELAYNAGKSDDQAAFKDLNEPSNTWLWTYEVVLSAKNQNEEIIEALESLFWIAYCSSCMAGISRWLCSHIDRFDGLYTTIHSYSVSVLPGELQQKQKRA